MGFDEWVKSPDVLVVSRKVAPGLRLIHQESRVSIDLSEEASEKWLSWTDEWDGWETLVDQAFVLKRPQTLPEKEMVVEGNDLVCQIAERHVKWYEETSDLVILFQSKPMNANNPLLALGPYGSLCWRGILAGLPIVDIRREAVRIFGRDEVLPFLARLMDLQFIQPIPEIHPLSHRHEELKKEFPAPVVQFQLNHSKIPWYFLWEICKVCDLRCKTCYLSAFKERGCQIDQAMAIAKQIIDAGIFYVGIFGGEPLLQEGLEQVIQTLREADVFVKIISNGQQMTTERARRLADAGINQVEISFDGLSRAVHEGSRGSGTFDQAIQALQCLRDAEIPRQGMVWTVHSGNVHEFHRLPQFMQEIGVTECYVSLFKKTGLQGSEAPYEPISDEETQRLIRYIQGWERSHPELTVAMTAALGCSCGRTSCVVDDVGDLRVCSFAYVSVGNVHQRPFVEIWQALAQEAEKRGPLGFCKDPAVEIADDRMIS